MYHRNITSVRKISIFRISALCLLFTIVNITCSDGNDPNQTLPSPSIEVTNLGEKYLLSIGEQLAINPKLTFVDNDKVLFRWVLDGNLVAETASYVFQADTPSKHELIFHAEYNGETIYRQIIIEVFGAENLRFNTTPYVIAELKQPLHSSLPSIGTWEAIDTPSDIYRLTYTDTPTPLFVAAEVGLYRFKVSTEHIDHVVEITVSPSAISPSPHIADVFAYHPAPGQFVNKLPRYEEGDTQHTMLEKVKQDITGSKTLVTLGGWGGFVTFGFDHTIVNVPGRCDFRVLGNAFGSTPANSPFGGSSEPGIIMVAFDKNKNGKPDEDEWYEIQGSSNLSPNNELWLSAARKAGNDVRTIRDYTITYHKPQRETPDSSSVTSHISIQNYIEWQDNQQERGYIPKIIYHKQTYFPAWETSNTLTFTGVRLPQNAVNEYAGRAVSNSAQAFFVLYAFQYGYADNYPDEDDRSAIDIDWAVTKDGEPANLPGIDFVKVYNGMHQQAGWLGETSTEVSGAVDLHLTGEKIVINK